MLPEQFTIADDFSAATYDEWRKLAETDLKGARSKRNWSRTRMTGSIFSRFTTRRDELSANEAIGIPGNTPFVCGSTSNGAVQNGWDLRQEHAHPDLHVTNRAMQDLEGGATSILLRLDSAARTGLDPDSPAAASLTAEDGVAAYSANDLDADVRRRGTTTDRPSFGTRCRVFAHCGHARRALAATRNSTKPSPGCVQCRSAWRSGR